MTLKPIPGAPIGATVPDFPGSTPPHTTVKSEPERPASTGRADSRFIGEYWDIAIAPIRDSVLAISLWRLIGHRDKAATEDTKYIGEVSVPKMRDFLRDALMPEATARLSQGNLEMDISRKRDGSKHLFVCYIGGGKQTPRHDGPIEDSILMAIRQAPNIAST
jgi:hypothetical protein